MKTTVGAGRQTGGAGAHAGVDAMAGGPMFKAKETPALAAWMPTVAVATATARDEIIRFMEFRVYERLFSLLPLLLHSTVGIVFYSGRGYALTATNYVS